jgi:hypothetical protein
MNTSFEQIGRVLVQAILAQVAKGKRNFPFGRILQSATIASKID